MKNVQNQIEYLRSLRTSGIIIGTVIFVVFVTVLAIVSITNQL